LCKSLNKFNTSSTVLETPILSDNTKDWSWRKPPQWVDPLEGEIKTNEHYTGPGDVPIRPPGVGPPQGPEVPKKGDTVANPNAKLHTGLRTRSYELFIDPFGTVWLLTGAPHGRWEIVETLEEARAANRVQTFHQQTPAYDGDDEDEGDMDVEDYEAELEEQNQRRELVEMQNEERDMLDRKRKQEYENRVAEGLVTPVKPPRPAENSDTPLKRRKLIKSEYNPIREFLRYAEIPGPPPKDIDALPKGFPGTENRIEKDPWGISLHNTPNLGPRNTVTSLDEAIASGPISEAAWTHDILVSQALEETDPARRRILIEDADNRFIYELERMPTELRGEVWGTARRAVRGTTLFYDILNFINSLN